ncbi:uncharacterized protein LOC124169071 [Ischnura elegans]|uniref:uncharacterized protein LOC124169071 n=1 Tax=Ischnura elegans TaxID=197161 RepID=UPI001ED8A524|nr:uncharacterized protein LOC124169071 [Ischnura elegans]
MATKGQRSSALLVLLPFLIVGAACQSVVPTWPPAGVELQAPGGANAAPSIGTAEVIDEAGCWDTEFRLTCRQLDSTIAILDARFLPSTATEYEAFTTTDADSTSAVPTETTIATGENGTLTCAGFSPPPDWLQESPYVRTFSPDGSAMQDPLSAAENQSFPWPLTPNPGRKHFRLALNRRCSGVNHCSFILAKDFEEAKQLWGPGAVHIKYACMRPKDRQLLRFCNKEVVAGVAPQSGGDYNYEQGHLGEGFVASPGYPNYYVMKGDCQWLIRPRLPGQRVQVTLLDVSLRGVGPHEQECPDWLEVSTVATPSGPDQEQGEERVLLSGCGEAPEAVRFESPQGALRVALRSSSPTIYTKRGVLFHYKALGCGWPNPDTPKDGYLVTRNATAAYYMCCVGFKFPDTGIRQRELRCDEEHGLWRIHEPRGATEGLLPDCIIDGDSILVKGNITKKLSAFPDNSKSTEKLKMKKAWMETDLMFDILIPTIIIGILLFGNGIIIFIIFQIKKRKLATELQEEELQIAQNGTELMTGKPSDV